MSELLDTKYNYVFYNVGLDFLKPIFGVLSQYPMVKTYGLAIKSNPLVEKLFFLHWSAKINSKIKLPLKNIWFKKMFDVKFENDKPICYVFYEGKYILDAPKVYDYIKTLNSNNKCVIYFGDLISKMDIDIQKAKECSDFQTTYDIGEAKKYNIGHYDDVFYGPIIEITEPQDFLYDIYFLGFAKDRLKEIHETFFALKNNGFRCKFIVCGVEENDRLNVDGLEYSTPIPYIENLRNVNNSKCILELIQGGSSSLTLRTSESQVFMRKLLTNNLDIKNQDYYDENNMSIFVNNKDIDFDFIRKDIDYSSFVKRDYYNPIRLLEYLEKELG